MRSSMTVAKENKRKFDLPCVYVTLIFFSFTFSSASCRIVVVGLFLLIPRYTFFSCLPSAVGLVLHELGDDVSGTTATQHSSNILQYCWLFFLSAFFFFFLFRAGCED